MINNLTSLDIFKKTLFYRRDNKPPIAIVGCGAIADTFYLPAILKNGYLPENIFLVDKDETRLDKLSQKYKIKNIFSDYLEILGKVKGAIIAAPNHLHYKISCEFLGTGTHVLCEKPLAETSEEAINMVELSRRSKVTISVNNTRRLFPSYIRIKEIIDSGLIGNIYSIKYINGFEFNWPTTSGFYFNYKKGNAKGVLIDQGSHVLDVICWWLSGKPVILSCQNDSFGGIDSVAIITLKKGSCDIYVKLSWLSKLKNTFKIAGEKGTIEGNIEDFNSFKITDSKPLTKRIKVKSNEKEYIDFADDLIKNFTDVINKQSLPLIPGRNIIPSIQVIEECYKVSTRLSMPWYESLMV